MTDSYSRFFTFKLTYYNNLKLINLSLEPNCRMMQWLEWCSHAAAYTIHLCRSSFYDFGEQIARARLAYMINVPVDMVENVCVYVTMTTPSDVTAAGAVPESWRERLALQLINSN